MSNARTKPYPCSVGLVFGGRRLGAPGGWNWRGSGRNAATSHNAGIMLNGRRTAGCAEAAVRWIADIPLIIPTAMGHPRYPARDSGAERLVLAPKRLLERGFFDCHNPDVEEDPEQRAVDDEAPIAHQHRLTQDDGNERDVYWITHITVETGHHEIQRRRDGRGGAETLQRETSKCVNEPRHACENQYRAEAARQLQTKERRLELPTRDRPWNEPRQRTWGDHEENRRAQDGNRSVPDTRRCELIPTS